MRLHTLAVALSLSLLLPLAGCGADTPVGADQAGTGAQASDSMVGRGVQAAMARAAEKLETGNITIGGEHDNGFRWGEANANLPRAEITPTGELLIEGKPVAVDARQRQLLLEHRARLIEVAKAGMAIGVRGADLGVKAATGALKAVFSGTTDEFGQRMEAEGKSIEQAAQQVICSRLPGLRQSQDALAAAVPEFVPYATLDQADVENCGKDGHPGSFDISAGEVTADADADAAPDATMDAAAEANAAAARQGTDQ